MIVELLDQLFYFSVMLIFSGSVSRQGQEYATIGPLIRYVKQRCLQRSVAKNTIQMCVLVLFLKKTISIYHTPV